MKFYSFIHTPYKKMLLVSDGDFLTGSYFEGQKYFPDINSSWQEKNDLTIFIETKKQLDEYFQGGRTRFTLKHKFDGNNLQNKVWSSLSKIPFGKTLSYKNIAHIIGNPKSIRSVASQIGRNPLSIIAPCHRVIGSDGSLKGYAAGLDIKKNLLELEKNT